MQQENNTRNEYEGQVPEDFSIGRAEYNPNKLHELDKSQKIAVVILAFFAFFVVGLWFTQAKKGLMGNKASTTATSECTSGTCSNNSSVQDTLKDTDKDGLTDYNELNFYNTSPYLEDTDSDGYNDKYEIDNNTDPNCPQGNNCTAIEAETVSENNVLEPVDMGELPSNTPSDVTSQINSAQTILEGSSDASSLRQFLLDAGMDPAVLNQISDEELMTSYQDVLQG